MGVADLESIVRLILKYKPELTREKILEMVEERVRELGGLIEEDAAALLIAKELGVPLPKEYVITRSGKLRIGDLIPGLRGVRLVARVLRVPSILSLDSGKRILRLLLGDESGTISLVLWNEQADRLYEELVPGDCLLIEGAVTRRYRGRLELSLSRSGRVEVLGGGEPCRTLPPLEELAKKHGVSLFSMTVCEVIEGDGGACVYGLREGGPVQLLLPSSTSQMKLERGDVILVQDARELKGGLRVKATSMTRVFRVSRESPAINSPFLHVDVDDVVGEEVDRRLIVGIRGLMVAALPFSRGEGGSIILASKLGSLRIYTFYDPHILRLNQVAPTSSLEILGVYSTATGRFRLNPYARIIVHEKELGEEGERISALVAKPGLIRCRATVLSCSFRYRLSRGGSPLLGAAVVIDDGTDRARILLSYNQLLCELLASTWSEVLEYANVGVLPKILSHVEEELVGVDVYVEGMLSADGVLAASRIKILQ